MLLWLVTCCAENVCWWVTETESDGTQLLPDSTKCNENMPAINSRELKRLIRRRRQKRFVKQLAGARRSPDSASVDHRHASSSNSYEIETNADFTHFFRPLRICWMRQCCRHIRVSLTLTQIQTSYLFIRIARLRSASLSLLTNSISLCCWVEWARAARERIYKIVCFLFAIVFHLRWWKKNK